MNFNAPLHSFLSSLSLPSKSKILVACSGGPDSVALAWALKSIQPSIPYSFILAHVNHRLRGRESELDARFVQRLSRDLEWPFRSQVRPITRKHGNLEGKARVERYSALQEMASLARCRAILTAHTKDDQVETVLLNLFRGCGLDGLIGMRESRQDSKALIPVLRPFLNVKKTEIRAYLKENRHNFRLDQSNSDLTFRRNWIRNSLIKKLSREFPGVQENILRFADIVRREDEVWESLLQNAEKNILRTWKKKSVVDIKKLLASPVGLQRRLLRRRPGGDLLTFDGIERLRDWLRKSPSNGRIWQLRKGWVAERLSRSQGAPSAQWLWIRPASRARKIAS